MKENRKNSDIISKIICNYFAVPQTREWLFVSSPYPLLLIIFGYIYFVLYAGPRYMKDRPPYKLKTFILIYNTIQILANLWFVKEHISAGWIVKQRHIICETRHSFSLNAIKVSSHNIIIIVKIIDFIILI